MGLKEFLAAQRQKQFERRLRSNPKIIERVLGLGLNPEIIEKWSKDEELWQQALKLRAQAQTLEEFCQLFLERFSAVQQAGLSRRMNRKASDQLD